MNEQAVRILYTNHEGRTSSRVVIPVRRKLFFGSTEHHPHEQWLLEAYCTHKKALRHFAVRDIWSWFPAGDVSERNAELVVRIRADSRSDVYDGLDFVDGKVGSDVTFCGGVTPGYDYSFVTSEVGNDAPVNPSGQQQPLPPEGSGADPLSVDGACSGGV